MIKLLILYFVIKYQTMVLIIAFFKKAPYSTIKFEMSTCSGISRKGPIYLPNQDFVWVVSLESSYHRDQGNICSCLIKCNSGRVIDWCIFVIYGFLQITSYARKAWYGSEDSLVQCKLLLPMWSFHVPCCDHIFTIIYN